MDSKPSAPYDAPPPYPGGGEPGHPYQPLPPGFNPPPPVGGFAPPAGGYAAPPEAGQQTATNVTVVHVAPLAMSPHPMQMTCPQCRAQIVTGTKTEAGLLTYIICGLCIFFGCVCGCCLIPFCVNECQDVDHICPNCKATLGRYRRL